MKIISKYKDYYDYLQGTWGVDEKLVLDRTKYYHMPYLPSENTKETFYICGYRVEGLFKGGRYHYGKELEKYDSRFSISTNDADKRYYDSLHKSAIHDACYRVHENNNGYYRTVSIEKQPHKLTNEYDPNFILNCPILLPVPSYGQEPNTLRIGDCTYQPFPILKQYAMHKVFPPEKMWLMLSEWLGREKPIADTRTNKEKIVGKGFDNKTSFRNIK